ncbi:hypothetical protein MTR67_023954 [Solanum verrucosum]|uniref:Uncharacterized protein n=1 Tax=Solanum verrucosum TaxID=315347 RepID=A0AAF0QUH2_SOLVR|nr:hypothetical protein MTR67_023954 [Solanum verrucosum]
MVLECWPRLECRLESDKLGIRSQSSTVLGCL